MPNKSLYYPTIFPRIQLVLVKFATTSASRAYDKAPKQYTYKCNIPDIAIGDVVVVETYDSYSVAKVSDVNVPPDLDSKTTFRWVVQRLDLHAHKQVIEHERRVIAEVEAKRVANMRQQVLSALGLTSMDILSLESGMQEEVEVKVGEVPVSSYESSYMDKYRDDDDGDDYEITF